MNFFKKHNFALQILIAFILAWSNNSYSDDPVGLVSPYKISLKISGHTLKIPYFRNYTLGSSLENIDHAVVIIHGLSRNVVGYYLDILEAAKSANNADETTIIIAPQFLIKEDLEAHNQPNDILFWSSNGWKIGHKSKDTDSHPRPARISSFAVVDTILQRLAVNNSNLKTIVLAGHSAGGQFANRFAAGSQVEQTLNSDFGIHVRYIVANPSSYLYFNKERRVGAAADVFAIPANPGCSDYNEYKYGLDDLNSYMSEVGTDRIRAQYRQREVIYLLGAEDNDPDDSALDKGCPAMLQGIHRLERGIIYYNYLAHYYDTGIYAKHEKVIIPGIGHTSDIFKTSCAIPYLFDSGNSAIAEPAAMAVPQSISLSQNYPNPFNPRTVISYQLPVFSNVTLKIYDVLGQEVRTLVNGNKAAGNHSIIWDGKNEFGERVGSGVYFYKLGLYNNISLTKKMLNIK